jgi:hypothetical protein
MRGTMAVSGFGLFVAMLVSAPGVALAEGTPTSGQNGGQQSEVRPTFNSLMNGSAWPQLKGDRETQYEASAVIQVDGDAMAMQISSPTVALLTTSVLVERAAQKAIGMDRAKVREALQVIATSAGHRMTRLEVRLLKTPGVEWKEDEAVKMIDALADALRAALQQSATAATRLGAEDAAQLANELAAANQKLANLQKEQQEIRQKLAEIPPQYLDRNVGDRSVQGELRGVEQQLRMYEEQLATKNPAASELLDEWQELVKLREEKLKQLQDEKRPAAEVRDAEIALTEARAKLAQTQAGSGRFPASDAAEVARLKARIEQNKKKQAELQTLADKLRSPEWQNLLERQDQLRAEEQDVQREIITVRGRSQPFRRQPAGRYVVTILDGRE